MTTPKKAFPILIKILGSVAIVVMAVCLSLLPAVAAEDDSAFLPKAGQSEDDSDLLSVLAPDGVDSSKHSPANTASPIDGAEASEEAPASPLRFRLETSITAFDRRPATPQPPSQADDMAARIRLVGEGTLPMSETLSFRMNSALTMRHDMQNAFESDQDITLDLREAYLLWQPGVAGFEVGRINVRHGVALGYNPVDFFRLQDANERTSLNPAEARLNRLGALAFRGSYLWDSGAASLTLAPEVTGGGVFLHDEPIWGLNLSSTNPRDRALFTYTNSISEGFTPEFFALWDDGDLSYGIAASAALGDKWLVYGEWSGGPNRSLIDAALYDFRLAGSLDPILAAGFGGDQGIVFKNKVALGFSYTSVSNIILNMEYHYNQAGLDHNDWDTYFNLANASVGNARASGQLALIPLRAALELEPVSRHALFVRAVFNDVLPDLTLTTLANVSLVNPSSSLQLQATYDMRDDLSLIGRIGGTFGSSNSDFGSRSNRGFVEFRINYHF